MISARQTVLDILNAAPNKQLTLIQLGRKLRTLDVLGFGVETIDVVRVLVATGKVSYNKETDIVFLGRDNGLIRLHINQQLLEIEYKLNFVLEKMIPEDLEESEIKRHFENIKNLLNKALEQD